MPSAPSGAYVLSCAERTCAAATRDGLAAWDGTAWHEASADQLFGNLSGDAGVPFSPRLSCGGPRSCVAVFRGHAAVWDGQQWTGTTDAVPRASVVSCVTVTFCLATGSIDGSGEVHRWNGSAWSNLPPIVGLDGTSATANVFDVECWAENRCYILALGEEEAPTPAGQQGRLLRTRLFRWDGTGYTETVAPSRIRDISCSSGSACVALRGTLPAMWLKADGWHELPPLPTTPDRHDPSLASVACDVAGCIGGGYAIDATGRTVAAAYRMDFGRPRY
jgi:hypothetical protein